ncbi:GNAT family N-acetyltransferase [Microbacterium invictum]|uniref:GNAT family N-acetyltransferase n=1 Tax=Microbacterium invictum TaxID=515415 RepID=A0ABZ0V7M0_9MICO|nr:GNAT family N-acetyltransferase [Microbacterium invictum]WQB69234.1 GNAT family N-acetyltransferase [Microbacterium invictum]
MSVEILPATSERHDDAVHALAHGDGLSCLCQWWMVRPSDFAALTQQDRERMLRDDLSAPVAPGLVAYRDGEAAGWVRVGPRPAQARIARTRAILGHSHEPLDDPSVWAVTCFAIRREHRGEGLMRELLDAAVAHARAHGARVIEGYPLDPSVKKRTANDLYHGTVSVFESAGFEVVARPKPGSAIVALPAGGAAD